MALGYKTGGRKKGSLNKITAAMREEMVLLMEREFKYLKEHLDEMETTGRAHIFFKLAPFAMPKIRAIEQVEKQVENKEPEIAWTTLKID